MTAPIRVLMLVCSLCAAAVAPARADVALATIPAQHAAVPLVVPPALGDPVWRDGALPGRTRYVNLTRHQAAQMETRAYLLYDDRNLYVALRCEQPAVPIVATQTVNDVGFGTDDFVGVGIDTSGTGSQVYFFESTPRGVRYQQASESARYRPVWSATASSENGVWSTVMTIPLAALTFAAGPHLTWRINLFRSVSALNEHFSWAYDPLMADAPAGNGWPAFTDARFWPRLTGLHIAAKRSASVPSVDIYALDSSGADHADFVAPGGSIEREQARNFGVDLTYPLTSTTSLVATGAPDFSGVEVDQQTIAPQEFARQLKEYRPFFAQGASFISANPYPPGSYVAPGDLLFYTPNIGPFDRGAKIEGTAGNSAFGAMSFRGYDSVHDSVFDDTAYGYKYALPDRSFQYWSDGVFAHHSDVTDGTAEFGIGGRNNVSGFVWQADDAFERRATRTASADHSLNAFVDLHKPNYELNVTYRDVSPAYGPVDGFTAAADLRGLSESININGAQYGLKNIALQLYADRYRDGSGAVHQADTYAFLSATLKNGWSIDSFGPQTGVLRSYDAPANADCTGPTLGSNAYSGAPCYRAGNTNRFDLFNASIGYREGTSTPATLAYSQGPFGPAYVHQFSTTASRPLAKRLSLGIEYDGTLQRSLGNGSIDSQWLRRISLGCALGADENMTFSLRAINGAGGYALPGVDVAAGYHKRYRNGNDLYVNVGTPAAAQTLHRLIIKYVLHLGPLRA